MFVDPTQEYFVPTINRNSQELAATLHPIHERQGFEERKRRDRMAQLTAAVDSQRKKEETFAPKTNPLPHGISLENRVPLAERSNAVTASIALAGKNAAASEQVSAPVVNATSESLVRSGARQAALEGHQIRRQVQELWSSFAVDSTFITKAAARQCLLSIGATAETTVRKFLQALGFQDEEHAEHHLGGNAVRGVDYDRFSRVLAAVLKAARTTTTAATVTQGQSRSGASVAHSKSKGDKQPTHAAPQAPARTSPSSRRISTPTATSLVDAGPTAQKRTRRGDEHRASGTTESRKTAPTSRSPSPAREVRASAKHRSDTAATQTHRHPLVMDIPTFSSQINHNIVLPATERGAIHARPKRREETQLAMERYQQERRNAEMRECTFHPVITAAASSAVSSRRRSLSASVDSARPDNSRSEVRSDKRSAVVAARVTRRLSASPRSASDEAGDDRAAQREGSDRRSPSPRRRYDDADRHARHIAIGEDTLQSPTEVDGDADDRDERLPRQHSSSQKDSSRRRTPLRSTLVESHRYTPPTSRSPSIASTSISTTVASGVLGVTRGFDKAVQRMAAARALSKPRFEESLRGGSHAYDPHVFPEDLRTKGDATPALPAPPTVSSPFHFRTDDRSIEREQSKPFLYVDVDLPHGKVGRIGVHRGDSAAQLAKSFCASYGLEENTCYRLTDILQEKIDAVLRERTRTLWV